MSKDDKKVYQLNMIKAKNEIDRCWFIDDTIINGKLSFLKLLCFNS